jgi:hypothetical protein
VMYCVSYLYLLMHCHGIRIKAVVSVHDHSP